MVEWSLHGPVFGTCKYAEVIETAPIKSQIMDIGQICEREEIPCLREGTKFVIRETVRNGALEDDGK